AEIFPGVIEAIDIRPHEPDIVFPADFLDLVLTLHISGLSEAGWDENRARDILLAAFDKCLCDELCRDSEDGHIDVAWDIFHRGIGLISHDFGGLGMDGINRAFIAAIDETLHHRIADFTGLGRGADHSHGFRFHYAVHRADNIVLAWPVTRLLRLPIA